MRKPETTPIKGSMPAEIASLLAEKATQLAREENLGELGKEKLHQSFVNQYGEAKRIWAEEVIPAREALAKYEKNAKNEAAAPGLVNIVAKLNEIQLNRAETRFRVAAYGLARALEVEPQKLFKEYSPLQTTKKA